MKYLVLIPFLVGCSLPPVNDVKLFAGIERTSARSPLCDVVKGKDDQATSNMGATANLIREGDLEVDVELRHHSCIFSPDARSYNAIGIVGKWTIFKKGE